VYTAVYFFPTVLACYCKFIFNQA